jgi:hypothetical protein
LGYAVANSFHPSSKAIRALFEPHGFREHKIAADQSIGGRVFFRSHEDGRVEMAYAFTWSNFRLAAQDGTASCALHIRLTPAIAAPEDEAWRAAPRGTPHVIDFEPNEWAQVAAGIDGILATTSR